jgi:hypothetical protein
MTAMTRAGMWVAVETIRPAADESRANRANHTSRKDREHLMSMKLRCQRISFQERCRINSQHRIVRLGWLPSITMTMASQSRLSRVYDRTHRVLSRLPTKHIYMSLRSRLSHHLNQAAWDRWELPLVSSRWMVAIVTAVSRVRRQNLRSLAGSLVGSRARRLACQDQALVAVRVLRAGFLGRWQVV